MKRSVLAIICLALCGVMANVMAPRLFMGFNYLFGSIPALIALRYFGVLPGTVVGLAAAACTWKLWGHPYAMIWLTTEIIFVGLAIRRKPSRDIVFCNTLYWPVLGIPLLWIVFKFVMKLPLVGTIPAALLFWFTGIANSLCAQILMDWSPLPRWLGKPKLRQPVSIHRGIFQLMMVIVVIPAVFVLVINGRNTLSRNETAIVERTVEASEDLSRQVGLVMGHCRSILNDLEKNLDTGDLAEAEGLKTLLLQDCGITAIWRQRPGGTPQPIVGAEGEAAAADARPGDIITTGNGKAAILLSVGGIYAAMDPAHLGRTVHVASKSDKARLLTIVDRNSRIVFTTRDTLLGKIHYPPRTGGDTRMISEGVYHFLPPTPRYITLWNRVQRSWYAREVPVEEEPGWTMILEIPFAPYQKALLSWTSGAVAVLLALSLAALAVSRFFSRWITTPITHLAAITTDLAPRIYEGTQPAWPQSRLLETSALIENFKETAGELQTRFGEATEARRHLEDRVRERTEELQQAKEQAERVYRLVPSAICVLDLQKNIIIWNNKAAEITGLGPEEVLGRKCSMFCGSSCDLNNCPLEVDSAAMPILLKQAVAITKDGRSLTILKNLDYLRDAKGTAIGLIESFEDVTEQRKMEEQLRHAQKMKALGTLTGGIAHDFNNMISIIMGYTELLMTKPSLEPGQQEQLSHILEASNRAKTLTHGLLSFARPVTPNLEALNLNSVVSDSRKLLGRLLPESIEFDTHLWPEPLTVFSDRGQLGQILLNLVTNARDAITGNGKIGIYTEKTFMEETYCTIQGISAPGEYAVLRVSDTGCGIDAEARDRIFEPFYTTKGLGDGTGLGLSIVFGIIKQLSGLVKVYSEPGQGTSIIVALPLHQGEDHAGKIVSPPAAPKGGHETILVAEDETGLRDLTETVLKNAGYRVLLAGDGAEAVKIFQADPNRVDLVLLDVIMPRMNGRETAEAIWKIRGEIPIVFMSGYTDDVLEHGGFKDKRYQIFQKPFISRNLLTEIRKALDGG